MRTWRPVAFVHLFFWTWVPVLAAADTAGRYLTHVDEEHGFLLEYPARLTLRTFGPRDFALVGEAVFLSEGQILDRRQWAVPLGLPEANWLLPLIRERAFAACAADGPDGSCSCRKNGVPELFRNRHGLPVIKLYLLGTRTAHDAAGFREKVGPVYGVDLSSSGTPRALLIHFRRQALAPPEDEQMLLRLIHSIRLLP